ncbi:hypothetical protein SAMN02745702_01661 [Desulfobaculum bizertense DSM 18034]|uniref:Transcriptional regulator NrdR n=1 Tax=Desulfobaculum bizertense DSM 18034 TaxID=1121442 RepID=A0A1T4W615_9BACT|nr:hypothetical protein SAMN02745702_01661 [Desulfobaculum bizertense DSM 18034]
MFACPECEGVTFVRRTKTNEYKIVRRRICKECGYRFTTCETECQDASTTRNKHEDTRE